MDYWKQYNWIEMSNHGHYHACHNEGIGEMEFFELQYGDATQRIQDSLNLWESCGYKPKGFRAPGWGVKQHSADAISGYFDPIHVGHLEYIELSKRMGDYLVVIVNNNHQCVLKKGKPFMDENDRVTIVSSIKYVDEVFLSIDKDKTVCKSLEKIKPDIFANGGDRKNYEVPESVVCNKYNIEIIDGLGEKIRSSSDLTGLIELK